MLLLGARIIQPRPHPPIQKRRQMAAQPHQLTAEEFAALPREGLRLELVRGELRAMPPAFSDHGAIAMQLDTMLGHYILFIQWPGDDLRR
jgi:hypothetical protein